MARHAAMEPKVSRSARKPSSAKVAAPRLTRSLLVAAVVIQQRRSGAAASGPSDCRPRFVRRVAIRAG
ncbi:hypothetical protein D5S18_27700 [Nocardia panacis]|uniref:Uncharacterized protein n=1 Tax=Nocardia panacis TaxID=2340916 RepID=A0A3A4KES1_9NOCA|nr:hypothetical protein D5S18_27700 [Nocardia panacis]